VDAAADVGVDGGDTAADVGADSGDAAADVGVDAAGDVGVDGGVADGGVDGDSGEQILPIEWVLIEVSDTSFSMGSPTDELGRYSDEVAHAVTLTGNYWMMATEITQAQFESVMGYNDAEFGDCGPNCPVENASWHEFAAYANALSLLDSLPECYDCAGTAPDVTCALSASETTAYTCSGYRLPTEAEWEYAARGGTTTATYNGDLETTACADTVLVLIAWDACNAAGSPHSVGTKIENAYGLSDMLGNVYEWCHDWYGGYGAAPATDPTGPDSGSGRVWRGASWRSSVRNLRAAFRNFAAPSLRSDGAGARLVRSQ
jgi:formylglycine-generating enzyme required for sulfatase activity